MDEPFVYFAVFQIYQTTFPPKGSKSGGENNYACFIRLYGTRDFIQDKGFKFKKH